MDNQNTALQIRPCPYPCPYHTACPTPLVQVGPNTFLIKPQIIVIPTKDLVPGP